MAYKSPGSTFKSAGQGWIDSIDGLSVAAQFRLAGIARSTVYADKVEVDKVELMLLRLLDEEYTRHPNVIKLRTNSLNII